MILKSSLKNNGNGIKSTSSKKMVKFSIGTIFFDDKSQAFVTTLHNYCTITRKLYDSGCSNNMFTSPLIFDTLILGSHEPIEIADGTTIYSKGYGLSAKYGRAMYVPI